MRVIFVFVLTYCIISATCVYMTQKKKKKTWCYNLTLDLCLFIWRTSDERPILGASVDRDLTLRSTAWKAIGRCIDPKRSQTELLLDLFWIIIKWGVCLHWCWLLVFGSPSLFVHPASSACSCRVKNHPFEAHSTVGMGDMTTKRIPILKRISTIPNRRWLNCTVRGQAFRRSCSCYLLPLLDIFFNLFIRLVVQILIRFTHKYE